MKFNPPPPDDDTEPPVITIIHEGAATTEDPGVWYVDVSDVGSGLAELRISIDGVVIIHEQDLGGIPSKSYSIELPAIEGVRTIQVYAKDDDNDVAGDQLETTVTDEITIIPPLPVFG